MNKQVEDIKAIRDLMEKSTKFLSLSGLSGVSAGITAIIGSAVAYFWLLQDPSATDYNFFQELFIFLLIAFSVLVIALSFGIYFSWKKARKSNQKLVNKTTLKMLYHLGLPLLTGGVFSLIFLLRGDIEMVASATLIFYGLALINVSKFTFPEVHYLGITEIVLGLISAIFLNHGIVFWTVGFGVCHILYGFIMYRKYDVKK